MSGGLASAKEGWLATAIVTAARRMIVKLFAIRLVRIANNPFKKGMRLKDSGTQFMRLNHN
jgi:hypothetical protein